MDILYGLHILYCIISVGLIYGLFDYVVYSVLTERVYYISKNKDGSLKRKALCLVGTDNSKAAFLEVHDQAAQIHPGLNRTLQAISKKYFWPRMTYDVNDWVSMLQLQFVSAIITLFLPWPTMKDHNVYEMAKNGNSNDKLLLLISIELG